MMMNEKELNEILQREYEGDFKSFEKDWFNELFSLFTEQTKIAMENGKPLGHRMEVIPRLKPWHKIKNLARKTLHQKPFYFTRIQEAIDAINPSGVIFIREGTYNEKITINKNDVKLRGSGYGTEIRLPDNTNDHVITIGADYERITIEFLRINGNKANQTSGNGIHGYRNNFITLRRLWIHDVHDNGVWTDFSWRSFWKVLYCEIWNVNIGIFLQFSTNKKLFMFNYIHDCDKYGINCERISDAIFAFNQISRCYRNGMRFGNKSSNNFIAFNIITENDYGDTASYDGIHLDGTTYENIVVFNRCCDNDRYEIGVFGNRNIVLYNILNGSDHVAPLNDLPATNFIGGIGIEVFTNLLASSPTHVHDAITPDGASHTDVTSPDVPRALFIRINNTDSANPQTPSGGDIVIHGYDAQGRSVTETLTVPASEIPAGGYMDVEGNVAFATVTQVDYYSETNTNITISVGITDKLGLSAPIAYETHVFKQKRNNSDESVGTVNTEYSTVNVSPISSGDTITLYYRKCLNVLS